MKNLMKDLLTNANLRKTGIVIYILMLACVFSTAFSEDELKYRNSSLSTRELELWNDPDFKMQFIQSYIAETDIEPRVTVDERDDMQDILELISSDKMDEAAEKLKKLRNEAATAVFDFTLANIYFQQEKLDQAAEVYRVAVNKYPKFRRAWKNLGLIHIRKSEFEEAAPVLSKVIELGGGDSITYGLLGYAYSSVGNNLSAESAYRLAILLDPKTIDWKMGLARSFFKQQKYADAVTLCDLLIKENPDKANIWLLQANAYIGLKKPVKAAEIYELLDDLGKSTDKTLNMLGDIYINEELYEMAVESYIKAMKIEPKNKPNRPIRAAKVLVTKGALEETATLIKKIKEFKSDSLDKDEHKDLLKLEARLAVARGSGDKEAEILKEIVELDPLDGEALILLGQYNARKDEIEKAVFYYERAAAIEKYEADAKIRHAQLLVGEGKYKEALPLLKRAQQIKPRESIQKYLEQVERISRTQK